MPPHTYREASSHPLSPCCRTDEFNREEVRRAAYAGMCHFAIVTRTLAEGINPYSTIRYLHCRFVPRLFTAHDLFKRCTYQSLARV